VEAGSRAAANLAGLDVSQIERGDVLARPGTLRPTSMLDVDVTLLRGERPLKDQSRLRVHLASAEVMARVRLLDRPLLEGGATARAQLRLESPAVAGRGDRLVLRSYSPAATIGGAVVLDPIAPKRRRGAPRPEGDAAAALVAEAGPAGIDAATLAARLTVPRAALARDLEGRPELQAFGHDPVVYVSSAALETLARATAERLDRFHAEQPLRAAMPREELRARVFARSPEGAFERVVADLAVAGKVRVLPEGVASAGHTIRLTPEEDRVRRALVEAAAGAGLEGIDAARVRVAAGGDARLAERVARVLTAGGVLRRVGEALVATERLEKLKEAVRQRWPAGSRLDVAAFKEMTGLSRKFVIPLLEFLDRERVTRRVGADRFVLG
jgi:selenocysteine-specific elongation factor